jgi:hypothetical protein
MYFVNFPKKLSVNLEVRFLTGNMIVCIYWQDQRTLVAQWWFKPALSLRVSYVQMIGCELLTNGMFWFWCTTRAYSYLVQVHCAVPGMASKRYDPWFHQGIQTRVSELLRFGIVVSAEWAVLVGSACTRRQECGQQVSKPRQSIQECGQQLADMP